MEFPSNKYFRLSPGASVRLKYGYIIKCTGFKRIDDKIVEILCTYDENSLNSKPAGPRIKGTIHWVSDYDCTWSTVMLYDKLFTNPDISDVDNYCDFINPNSCIIKKCPIEYSLKSASPLELYQFERVGYFCVDTHSTSNNLIFNRSIKLNSNWTKILSK